MQVAGTARRFRWSALLVAGVVIVCLPTVGLGAPAQAEGLTRYAAPAGSGSACTLDTPCSLTTAVEDPVVKDGDAVVLTPGHYDVGQLEVRRSIELHGEAGQPVPTIATSGPFGVHVTHSAYLHDLDILGSPSAGTRALDVIGDDVVIDRVQVQTAAINGYACYVKGSRTLMRDTVCWASGETSYGLYGDVLAPVLGIDIWLRNVTSVGTWGMDFELSGPGSTEDVDARNVIAEGSEIDVVAAAEGGAGVSVKLRYSNFSSVQSSHDDSATVDLTNVGADTNQSAAPVFRDAAHGDFREMLTSPTVDAGQLDDLVGPQDFEGDPRVVATPPACLQRPDIGADEVITSGICVVPDTMITGGPSGATEDTTPTFQFSSNKPGSSFQCRIDGGGFGDCPATFTTPVLPSGSHELDVRAIDAHGQADPTPASVRFLIVAPETTISSAPAVFTTRHQRAEVRIGFASSSPGTFMCSLDGSRFRSCASPFTAKVGKGRHQLQVCAVNGYGTVDPTAASFSFRVARKHRHQAG